MFIKAKAIYPVGKSMEMNTFAAFSANVPKLDGAKLYVCASSFYRLLVNGNFTAHGPARCAGGYARVDKISLDNLKDGDNEVLILVAGYVCGSLTSVRQPSFLRAEIRIGDEVIRASGYDFSTFLPTTKITHVKRYSVQRHFTEVYDFRDKKAPNDESFATDFEEIIPAPTPITRRAPYPYCEDVLANNASSCGELVFDEALPFRTFTYQNPNEENCYFDSSLIEHDPYRHIERHRQVMSTGITPLPLSLGKNEYAIFDLKKIQTGFIRLIGEAAKDTDIIIGFSEMATPEHFKFTELDAYNAMEIFASGNLDFTSFEPYVGKYFIVAVKNGALKLSGFGVKTFMHSPFGVITKEPSDPELAAIYRAACRTFFHNALDIYTDCPSRERAGWLCDSYFTARTEYALFGNTAVEDAFLENYRLFENDGAYPDGAIPMCYPSDPVIEAKFIPQWTMWYILEVEEYVHKRGHEKEKELFRKSINGLLSFYQRYENSDELLEDLPSWNFVEWSRANKWTQNVNYPTAFLYAATLEAVYKLYGDRTLLEKSERIRRLAIEQSFSDGLFRDHATRDETGNLTLASDTSEIAQYYAILFGGIDVNAEKYKELRSFIMEKCPMESTVRPGGIEPINAFIGVYMRIETMLRLGNYELMLSEIKSFFSSMDAVTGTLWEYRTPTGSLDHGFASYVLSAILEALENM